MNYTRNAINVLTASAFKGIGSAWFVKNWQSDYSDLDIVEKLNRTLDVPITIVDFEYKRHVIETLLLAGNDAMDGVIAIGDVGFPYVRGNVKNSERPVFLFYKGNLSLLSDNRYNVAVIGLLTPTPEIERREQRVVEELVGRGATIVSGLALGCDSVAHRVALERGGKTIAILPGPLTSILPASNKPLAQQILAQDGLLVSEYLTEAKSKMALSGRYQRRDRLQTLFSDAVVLSASYAKNSQGLDSGSRLAMGYAASYGIPRAVIYDEAASANPMFDLNRQYLREDASVVVIDTNAIKQAIDVLQQLKTQITKTSRQIAMF